MTKRSQASSLPDHVAESRRRAPRVPLDVAATVEHEGEFFEAIATNAGVGGAFIATATMLAYGAKVVLHLPVPSSAEPLRLPGVVRWSNQTGFGIQFTELGARDTHALSALLAGGARAAS